MKILFVVLVILFVVGIGAFFFLKDSDSEIAGNNLDDEELSASVLNGGLKNDIIEDEGSNIGIKNGNLGSGETKTFVLTGENFKFMIGRVDNPEIRVNQGDKVRIEFSSVQGFHDWVLDEFQVATGKVRDTDGLTFVEFVVDKKGTFEYYCSVGQHRELGMRGKLVVE
jgi:plastocyanin